MRLKLLKRTHPDYDREMLCRYRDLFEGGERFARNTRRYLPSNTSEPAEVYQRRIEIAKSEFINYCGPIGNHFASWLMTSKPTYKSDPEEVDEFYEEFKEDSDYKGTDFDQFLRDAFVDALIDRCSYWRIEFPSGDDAEVQSEYKAKGLDRGTVKRIPTEAIVNWKRDRDGYVWLVEYECERGLEDPTDEDERVCETWTIWRRDGEHQRFYLERNAKDRVQPEFDVQEVEIPRTWGAIAGIPLAYLELPSELWLMNLLSGPQLSHWRKRVGLSWAIDRTCYAMPVFNVKNRRKPPTMGSGYYLVQGVDEKASYLSPPGGTYEVVENYLKNLKDEIHRVVQQMARGVDNNSAAVGRSGQSKRSDERQTEIVLSGFGTCTRAAAEMTMHLISEGRGEDIQWSVGGMNNYNVTESGDFIKEVVDAKAIGIPSVTYHREVAKRVAQSQLQDLDESMTQQISDEIDAGITEESIQEQPTPQVSKPSFGGDLDDGYEGTEAVDAVYAQLEDDFEPDAIEWVKSAHWEGPVDVELDRIDFSNKSAWRADKDVAKQKKFVKKISNGDKKPIILVQPPNGGKLKVADGHHRALAYQRLGESVKAYVATVDDEAFKAAMEMHSSQKEQPGGPVKPESESNK